MGNGANKKIKKTIGFVIEPYEEKEASGIAYATLEEMRLLQELGDTYECIFYSTQPIRVERLTKSARWVPVPSSFIGKNIWFIKEYMRKGKNIPDVLLFNMPLLPFILPKGIRTIPVFYERVFQAKGIALSKVIGNVFRKFLSGITLRRATRIIVPSKTTEEDVHSLYQSVAHKTTYIPLGYQTFTGEDVSILPPHPFFLYVGRVKYKKNIHMMLKAFCDFKDATKGDHVFVLAGRCGGAYTELLRQYARDRGHESDLLFFGHIYGAQLAALYRHATALVFVTLQEGFGMPVIEAMHEGIPVITSNISSLKEIAEGYALCVSPDDPNAIASAMISIVLDVNLRSQLIALGKERAKEFSWDAHGRALRTIVTEVLSL